MTSYSCIIMEGDIMKKKIKRIFKYGIIITFLIIGTFSVRGYREDVAVAMFHNDSAIEIKNKEDQADQIRSAMLNRDEKIVLKYQGSINELENDADVLMAEIFAVDSADTSTDWDYLKNIFQSYEMESAYTSKEAEITYHFTYDETKEETAEVDKKIKDILKKMKLDSKSDYEKIKLIHDYIVKNNAYDESLTYYSAYDVLFNKSSTCQGYALLNYKMLTEAGIPCRIITGLAGDKNPVNHAWNIVKLQGKWYNVDTTWDDPVTNTGEQILQYDYFLKNTADFKGHRRDAEYKANQFMKNYPMAAKSFTKAMDKGKK